MLGEVLSMVTALTWATSMILSADVLKEIDPLSVNAFRTLFSAILMLFIAFTMGEMQDFSGSSFSGLFYVILAAVIGIGVGDTCLLKGITLMGVSRSYTIAYTSPLFTMFLGTLFLGEPFHLRYLFGTVLIILGIVAVFANKVDQVDKIGISRGLLAAFAASILWSVGTILVAIGLRQVSPFFANAVRLPLLFVILILISQFWKKKLNLNRRNLGLLAMSGILGMVLGGMSFLFSVQLIGVSRATPLSASSPVWASLMSSIFLKEKVTWKVIMASIMVAVGIYFLI